MKAYVGQFTAATATGDQTVTGIVDEDGNAFTGKALIIWTTYQTAAGYSDTQGFLFQLGMADGTSQNSSYSSSDDNTSPNDSDRAQSATQICLIRNPAGTNIRVGTLSSFGSGQFVINWSTADAVAAVFQFLVVGGDELLAFTAQIASDIAFTAGQQVFPAGVIFAMTGAAADAGNIPSVGWGASDGAGAVAQGTACFNVRDNLVTSDTGRYQATLRCYANITTASPTTLFGTAEYTTLGAQGNPSGASLNYLVLGGIRMVAGSGLQPTSPGTQGVTGVGFKPKAVLYVTVGAVAMAVGAGVAEARLSVGAADRTRQGWQFCGAVDNVNPSRVAGGESATNVLVAATPDATGSSTTTDAEAALQSMDTDGFTLNWTTADATQRQYLWLAFGDGPSASSTSAPLATPFVGIIG